MNNETPHRKPEQSTGEVELLPLPYGSPDASYGLFERIRHLPMPVLLASGNSGHAAGRFDILCADPKQTFRSIVTDESSQKISTSITNNHDKSASPVVLSGNPFEILSQHFSFAEPSLETDLELPFTGGAMGYFSYELLHSDYRIRPDFNQDISLPPMLVGIYDWAIIVDHKKKISTLVLRNCSEQRRTSVLALLETEGASNAVESQSFKLGGAFRSNFSKQEYLQCYEQIIDYINAGDCYQVNLAQRFEAKCQGDSWQAFKKLQSVADAPFAAYLEDQGNAVLSFSPERFVQVTDRQVVTQPIKGTRPRNSDPEQDRINREDLENSSKDKAENLMIVDLLRNDLGRVCKTGSVSVESLFETQSFTNVHHLVSTINGELEKREDIFDLFSAGFPGGSITGTPKIRSMEVINELETRPRSIYCGSIAYIDYRGNMDSNICIRTLVRENDNIYCWGGGGIVADSVGSEEHQETLDKISIFINNL